MKYILLLLPAFLRITATHGQPDTGKIYLVKPVYELPASIALLAASSFGFKALDKVASFTAEDLKKLNPGSVNKFDRNVIFKNPANAAAAQRKSDLFLNISVVSPLVLMLDKKIRKDWLDLISLYAVTHVVDNAVYFMTAFPIRRARPYTYNNDIPDEEKIGKAKSNSFFSGHTSFSATSTFFLAKVFTDYHQIKGLKRIGIFTAASVPPALVAYYRMEAGKHFKTDVLLGFAVGAASGILIPEFRKKLRQKKNISLNPYLSSDGQSGLSLTYTFQ